jgi:hypothetical protein
MKSAVKKFTKALKINNAVFCKTVSRSVWNDAETDKFTVRPILGNSLQFGNKANVEGLECKFWYE